MNAPASLSRPHAGQDQLSELEQCSHLHLEHHVEPAWVEIRDGREVRDRSVVHQDVNRTEPLLRRCNESRPIPRDGQIGGDRGRLAASLADRFDRVGQTARQPALDGLCGTGHRRYTCPLPAEQPRDLGADAAAGTRHHRDPAVQGAHVHPLPRQA